MLTHTLGFPRIGRHRELKKAVESFWRGERTAADLTATCKELRITHWKEQRDAGIDIITVGDFSLYDSMLDTAAMVGCIPERYGWNGESVELDTYFAMARGESERGMTAMEMTKWFDTNYHYIVPEFTQNQIFSLSCEKLFHEIEEARVEHKRVKAVLPGPFTFLRLGKAVGSPFDTMSLLPGLLDVYSEIIHRLSSVCEWIQLDEPVLALNLPQELVPQFRQAYMNILQQARPAKVMLSTYFGAISHNRSFVSQLEIDALHLDCVRAPEQLEFMLPELAPQTCLSLGVVDGRNIWRVDAQKAITLCETAVSVVGLDRVMIAPSCSLLHTPVDLDEETALPAEVKNWMAFALQKCREVRMIADAVRGHGDPVLLKENADAWEARRNSTSIRNDIVRQRVENMTPDMLCRHTPYDQRRTVQRALHGLPLLPTTTIGSFPQTTEIRATRSQWKKGALSVEEYTETMRGFIKDVVEKQEEIGLDVLVHGEPERNDMVEYFGEQLDGFCFTKNGWVQSYGSRCVKPPVIFGDVSRPAPMTVEWTRYARSLTQKPMKGMLTGPVTILCWSFVRDDQPRSMTCTQIAFAIRDEVHDLERSGVDIIQIDEPALREGLPLRDEDKAEYLRWAVDCFRLAANGVDDGTQIHTHMCYAEFNEILGAIVEMDADVISIEASRSGMELLEAFREFQYPNEIGPGVYDIHSPRVPGVAEMEGLLRRAIAVIPVQRLWVNPDCGLKTRGWSEAHAALKNMVEAARIVRGSMI
ncbi:5-methyltetrahydropteroyltriglutamate--homocysteine S-methyltransferase [Desulfovibrio inopinatus]|uniref:5-methyltetrahydropteroyltriglutamate-- homocysteine S-methyltransferase n=1 Tax=Desulfovibrio inopinatus TaxID=102109 RepID=UPI0004065594|nr:5-methyltetrahydropteroyltriglutamate--homocysteine S-methyltransferase [Desulfovibrio inopinatus]